MVSQQRALLTLYSGLARGEKREARAKIYAAIDAAAERVGDEPPRLGEMLDRQLTASSVGDYVEEFRALAEDTTREDPVLAIQKLELLLAVSKRLRADQGGRLLEVVDSADEDVLDGLIPFMASLVEPDGKSPLERARLLATDVDVFVDLEDIHNPADLHYGNKVPSKPAVEQTQMSSLEVPSREAEPELIMASMDFDTSSDPDVEQNETDRFLQMVRDSGSFEPIDELEKQPSVNCLDLLIRLSIDGDQGPEGEYGTFIQSTVDFDNLDFPDLRFEHFTETLLDPTGWHTYHPFWCEMLVVEDGDTFDDVHFDVLDPQCVAEGSADDHWLILERVGICGENGNFFPRTFLCFDRDDNLTPFSTKEEQSLSYRLLKCQDQALAADDGQIVVTKEDSSIRVRITKTLHLRGINHQTEGQVLAEFACESGWAENTRALIVNALNSLP